MERTTVRGVDVPSVGLGTWRLSGQTCRRTVRTAIEIGYRHVDTAQKYGNERQVGNAIRDADVDREALFVTTKLGAGDRRHDDVIRATEQSLAKLKTSYVDLLLIHFPGVFTPLSETLSAMEELLDRGAVRNVGVSNFDVDRLNAARELAEHDIFADQVQYNPYWEQADLLDYCRIHDVLLTAYSPLAHGGVLDDPVLTEIGERYGKTPAQVAIRWLIRQPNVVTIPKASTREHLTENIDVFDFELTDEEAERIYRPSRLRALEGFLSARLRR